MYLVMGKTLSSLCLWRYLVSLHRLKRSTFPQTLAEGLKEERRLQETERLLQCFIHRKGESAVGKKLESNHIYQ